MTENNTTVTLAADDATAKALVDTIKSSVNGAGKYVAYVTAHGVTRETVKYHAAALAAFAYPHEKPVQRVDGKRTKFGNAVQAAGAGLRTALGKQESPAETVANLLTTDGLSTLKDMLTAKTVDTDALVAALAAEIARRSK